MSCFVEFCERKMVWIRQQRFLYFKKMSVKYDQLPRISFKKCNPPTTSQKVGFPHFHFTVCFLQLLKQTAECKLQMKALKEQEVDMRAQV